MSFKIAIASGKGGTGKTTVSVNLFKWFNEKTNYMTHLIDCDVEEPNTLFFFEDAIQIDEQEALQQIPFIDTNQCTFCRKCEEYCEFNAITILPNHEIAEINKSLCHSCGACLVACNHHAITEHPESIGQIKSYNALNKNKLTVGQLKVGSAMQTLMISKTKEKTLGNEAITLFDSPPGTSCPVVESVADVDYVVLVTEPTPFGLHDVKLMIELVENMNKPYGLVINKSGIGNNELYKFIEDEKIELLGQIPFNKTYASKYSIGKILEEIPSEIETQYQQIAEKLAKKIVK